MPKTGVDRELYLRDKEEALALWGRNNEFLRLLQAKFPKVKVVFRGDKVSLLGDDEKSIKAIESVIEDFLSIIRRGQRIGFTEWEYALNCLENKRDPQLLGFFSQAIPVASTKAAVKPRTLGQKEYVEAIREHDIVIAIGPAGTGKTYLAMAMAVSSFLNKEFDRLILTRPAIEAGERLGFLPGDLREKIDPYLRPLYDALYDMLEADTIERLLQRGQIEVAPLAFMRGRTLNHSFIILDEAQNTTPEQMKMFLTRLGYDSKTVITGDVTQIDLPQDKLSGLIEAQRLLKDIPGIKFVYLNRQDVVRHRLVQEIIDAYQKGEE